MRTPISRRRRTGGGKERAYMSAILKNRARNSLSLAFMSGFVPSTGIMTFQNNWVILQDPIIENTEALSVLRLQNVAIFVTKTHLTCWIVFATTKSFMFCWRIWTQIASEITVEKYLPALSPSSTWLSREEWIFLNFDILVTSVQTTPLFRTLWPLKACFC